MRRYIYKVGLYPVKLCWFLFRPSEYGAKCIIKKLGSDEILFIRNTYGRGSWNLPGGRQRHDESAGVTVRREVFEELGISLGALEKIGIVLSTFEYKKDYIHVFYAETDQDVGPIDRNELQDAKWFSIKRLPDSLAATANLCLALKSL